MAIVEVNWKPGRRQLRAFGAAGAILLAAIAAWVFFRRAFFGLSLAAPAASVTAGALLAAAVLLAILAAAAPRALRPLYLALTALGLPIGFVMSYVILGVVYFGLFTPIALIFRLVGRDALCRKFDRGASTYWRPHRATDEIRRYFRQS
jgi:hypothetical protein